MVLELSKHTHICILDFKWANLNTINNNWAHKMFRLIFKTKKDLDNQDFEIFGIQVRRCIIEVYFSLNAQPEVQILNKIQYVSNTGGKPLKFHSSSNKKEPSKYFLGKRNKKEM